ncbi:hypothetical protein J2Z48_002948 [Croceifilum oryzae]|uniref:Uncharacterized protein n=1 Tax=Croceifilum oryzae TaxID=1553429 RepID=A0AAJ1TM67_9BACL|nr:hypothetical protein [Croceifilum oryzae]MDQ0418744.1 hypothetical protein [Croceifilum oryzae]
MTEDTKVLICTDDDKCQTHNYRITYTRRERWGNRKTITYYGRVWRDSDCSNLDSYYEDGNEEDVLSYVYDLLEEMCYMDTEHEDTTVIDIEKVELPIMYDIEYSLREEKYIVHTKSDGNWHKLEDTFTTFAEARERIKKMGIV